MKKLRESSESEGEGDESRMEWLTKFSTMKVGPPKHVKPTMELKCLSLGASVTSYRVKSRPAGLKVKKALKKLHEHHTNPLLCHANKPKFPLILQISITRLRFLLGQSGQQPGLPQNPCPNECKLRVRRRPRQGVDGIQNN